MFLSFFICEMGLIGPPFPLAEALGSWHGEVGGVGRVSALRALCDQSLCLSSPLAQLARDNFFHCGVLYEDSLSSQVRTRMELEEDVKIYLEENYERINVPVPQFGGGDPADIIHDFQRVRPAGTGAGVVEGCPEDPEPPFHQGSCERRAGAKGEGQWP